MNSRCLRVTLLNLLWVSGVTKRLFLFFIRTQIRTIFLWQKFTWIMEVIKARVFLLLVTLPAFYPAAIQLACEQTLHLCRQPCAQGSLLPVTIRRVGERAWERGCYGEWSEPRENARARSREGWRTQSRLFSRAVLARILATPLLPGYHTTATCLSCVTFCFIFNGKPNKEKTRTSGLGI